jgi:hypothetical protein
MESGGEAEKCGTNLLRAGSAIRWKKDIAVHSALITAKEGVMMPLYKERLNRVFCRLSWESSEVCERIKSERQVPVGCRICLAACIILPPVGGTHVGFLAIQDSVYGFYCQGLYFSRLQGFLDDQNHGKGIETDPRQTNKSTDRIEGGNGQLPGYPWDHEPDP